MKWITKVFLGDGDVLEKLKIKKAIEKKHYSYAEKKTWIAFVTCNNSSEADELLSSLKLPQRIKYRTIPYEEKKG